MSKTKFLENVAMQQVKAGENAIIEKLRSKGLCPKDVDSDGYNNNKEGTENMIEFKGKWQISKYGEPKETGMYLCVVREITDLSVNKYRWVCAYNSNSNRWSDNGRTIDVICWSKLPPFPC